MLKRQVNNMDRRIWLGVVELEFTTEGAASKVKRGFTNVTTWAFDYKEFCTKAAKMIDHYGWKLLAVDEARAISEGEELSSVVEDMVARTRTNPSAVICGTIHKYSDHAN